jgi:hypothetical protein
MVVAQAIEITKFMEVYGSPPTSGLPDFHGGNTGSIPVGRASKIKDLVKPSGAMGPVASRVGIGVTRSPAF